MDWFYEATSNVNIVGITEIKCFVYKETWLVLNWPACTV